MLPSLVTRARRSALVVAAVAAALLANAATVAAATIPAVPTVTAFHFSSATGDYIGQGQTESFAPPADQFTLYAEVGGYASPATTQGLTVYVNAADGEWWYVTIAPPQGQLLHTGTYSATRAPFQTGTEAGLEVSGDGRGCNQSFDSFTIKQLTTTSAGVITALDATFTQHCELATAPALTCRIQVNATQPRSYAYGSDAGDYIGQGQSNVYVPGNAALSLVGLYGNGSPTLNGVELTVSASNGDWWNVNIAPAKGTHLHTGSFSGAQRAAFRTGSHPGLDVFGDGRGCNTLTGSFSITLLQTNSSGVVTALAATFVQHCEGAAPALDGSVHWG